MTLFAKAASRLSAVAVIFAMLSGFVGTPIVRAQFRGQAAPSVSVAPAISVAPAVTAAPSVSIHAAPVLAIPAPAVALPAPVLAAPIALPMPTPSVIVHPPPPPPPPVVNTPLPFVPMPDLSQRQDLTPPCLTCVFKPPPGPPQVDVVEESPEQKRVHRLAEIEDLRSSAEQLLSQGNLKSALDKLDALLALLDREGSEIEPDRVKVRAVIDLVALNLGKQLFNEQKYEEALAAFARSSESAEREELAAKCHFELGRIEEAFSRLNALSTMNAELATRPRGYFFESLGALDRARTV